MTSATVVLVQGPSEILGIQLTSIARVVGFTLLSFVVAACVGAAFRWYFRQRASLNVTILAGMASVALYLNTRTALNQVMANNTALFEIEAVVFNTVAFFTAGLAAAAGGRVGDRTMVEFGAFTGAVELEGEVSKVVQAVGRRIAVTIPEEVQDIDGYDPVPDETKEKLAGKTFLFPRGLTVGALRDRFVARLKDDYHVGYVDVDLAGDGTVEYFAVGQRVPGIGPTLGPGQAAAAVTADPPNAASPGDLVQVWRPRDGDEPAKRVATAELRGIADDVVTLALDEHEAREIAGESYRLITLPAEPRAEREFAGLLRAADETLGAITIVQDSVLVGQTVGDLDTTVVAVKPADGAVEAIPSKGRDLAAGQTLYVVARPDRVRRLEADATTPVEAEPPGVDEATTEEPSGSPGAGGDTGDEDD